MSQTGNAFNFAAGGRPMQETDFAQARQALGGIDANLLWALLHQEGSTPPVGFLTDRRPKILYERHIFAALTKNQFTAGHGDISGPRYTVYGTLAQQYDRLNAAMALDAPAALQACSWGLAQVLGQNATDVGYADVAAMVQAMIASEAGQLTAAVRFLQNKNCLNLLVAQDWTNFASRYNGTANVAAYAASLQGKYNDCVQGPAPDFRVRAAQLALTYLHHPLAVDGVPGPATTNALRAFQQLAGIAPADGSLSDATFDAIMAAAFT